MVLHLYYRYRTLFTASITQGIPGITDTYTTVQNIVYSLYNTRNTWYYRHLYYRYRTLFTASITQGIPGITDTYTTGPWALFTASITQGIPGITDTYTTGTEHCLQPL